MRNLIESIITLQALPKISAICAPLNSLGIKSFSHDITFGRQRVSMLTNQQDLFLAYYHNGWPVICTDDSGRTLEEGIYSGSYLAKKYPDCALMFPKIFEKLNLSNSIHIVERQFDCQHFYSFCFNLEEAEFFHTIINSIDKIKNFIENYKNKAAGIISDAKKNRHQIILPYWTETNLDLLNNQYDYFLNQIKSPSKNQYILIHKDNGKPIALSLQQKKCLFLLVQGLTAKQIAKTLNLSYRTVEHYFEKIRAHLGCRTSKEIIFYYFDQLIK